MLFYLSFLTYPPFLALGSWGLFPGEGLLFQLRAMFHKGGLLLFALYRL